MARSARERSLGDSVVILQNKAALGSEKLHYSELIAINLSGFEFPYGSYIFIWLMYSLKSIKTVTGFSF